MSNAGFDVAGNPNQLFDRDEDFLRAEYKIGGQLTELQGQSVQKG